MSRPWLRPFLLWLLVQAAPAAAGEPLGRLILSPAERQVLDRQRQRNPAYLPAGEGGERPLRIIGELRSNGGRQLRWRDGDAGEPTTGVAAPRLPVGDRLHPATGRQERLLRDGRLRIHRNGGQDAER